MILTSSVEAEGGTTPERLSRLRNHLTKNRHLKKVAPSLPIVFSISQQLITNAISVPATAIIIREMGAASYGSFTTAAGLIGTVGFLTNLGLRMGFLRDVVQNSEDRPQLFAEQVGLRLLLASIATTIAVLAAHFLRYPPVIELCVLVGGIGLIMSTFVTVFTDYFQAIDEMKQNARINLIAGLTLTAASVLVVKSGGQTVALALVYLINPLLSLVLFWRLTCKSQFRPSIIWNVRRYCELLYRMRHLTLQLVTGTLSGQVQSVLVPKLAGITAFGYFSAGTLVTGRLSVVTDVLSSAYFPALTRFAKAKPAVLLAHLRKYFLVSLFCSFTIALLASLAAGPIAHLLFPKNAFFCQQSIRITAWALPLCAVDNVMSLFLVAVGRQQEASKRGIQTMSAGFVSTVVLIYFFGFSGACWSAIVCPTIAICNIGILFRHEMLATHHFSLSKTIFKAVSKATGFTQS